MLVRGRPFVVEQLLASRVPKVSSTITASQALVRLSSLEDDSLGEQLEVVWELEVDAEIKEASSLPQLDGFDHPGQLDTFLHAVR